MLLAIFIVVVSLLPVLSNVLSHMATARVAVSGDWRELEYQSSSNPVRAAAALLEHLSAQLISLWLRRTPDHARAVRLLTRHHFHHRVLARLCTFPSVSRRVQVVTALAANRAPYCSVQALALVDSTVLDAASVYVGLVQAGAALRGPIWVSSSNGTTSVNPHCVMHVEMFLDDPGLLEAFCALTDGWTGSVDELFDVARRFA